jgi:hypothetical protein
MVLCRANLRRERAIWRWTDGALCGAKLTVHAVLGEKIADCKFFDMHKRIKPPFPLFDIDVYNTKTQYTDV